MKYFFLFALTSMCLICQAQNLVGIRIGTNFSNISIQNLFDTQARISAMGALTFDRQLNDRFSVGGELFYNTRGYRSDIEIRDDNNYLLATDEFIVKYSYLSIPMKAGLSLGNKTYTFFNAGIIPSLLLGAVVDGPEIGSDNRPTGNRMEEKITAGRTVDVAGLIEAGAGYHAGSKIFFMSLMGQKSFTTVTANSGAIKPKHYGAGVSFGVKFQM